LKKCDDRSFMDYLGTYAFHVKLSLNSFSHHQEGPTRAPLNQIPPGADIIYA